MDFCYFIPPLYIRFNGKVIIGPENGKDEFQRNLNFLQDEFDFSILFVDKEPKTALLARPHRYKAIVRLQNPSNFYGCQKPNFNFDKKQTSTNQRRQYYLILFVTNLFKYIVCLFNVNCNKLNFIQLISYLPKPLCIKRERNKSKFSLWITKFIFDLGFLNTRWFENFLKVSLSNNFLAN